MKKILETERLNIREFDVNDSSFILKLVNTPGWLSFIGDRNIHTLTEAQEYLVQGSINSYTEHGFGFWMMELKDQDNAPIGMCGLAQRDYLSHPDVGYALLPEFEGKGYAFEAASAVLNYARQTLGLKYVLATTKTNNDRSIKLLEKLGLKYERLLSVPHNPDPLQLMSVVFE